MHICYLVDVSLLFFFFFCSWFTSFVCLIRKNTNPNSVFAIFTELTHSVALFTHGLCERLKSKSAEQMHPEKEQHRFGMQEDGGGLGEGNHLFVFSKCVNLIYLRNIHVTSSNLAEYIIFFVPTNGIVFWRLFQIQFCAISVKQRWWPVWHRWHPFVCCLCVDER